MAVFNLSRACRRFGWAIAAVTAMSNVSLADAVLDRDLFADTIGDKSSSFLALDLQSDQRCMLSDSDLETRHAPWSTFKIPNMLIALGTGHATGINDWRDWDRERRPPLAYWPREWRQGQTLESAFRRSALWYFQDIALDVGAPQYRETLTQWGYGNASAPNGSDSFWLGGLLALSVNEQTRFLQRLLTGGLTVDKAHLAGLMQAAEAGPLGNLTLYGKTGAGPVREGEFSGMFEGWYVGWLMHGDATKVVFAHHARGRNFSAIRSFRQSFAKDLLIACGFATGAK
ncbi:penicillin-binding transpeptidase domain-containing protein [uncultured Litoreibacter sp.]|uniref:penicillin-binding transpeptidase domain-containing protein n=1 Tax=uncultured Litoreibacter sp. TaxID=1392394 RepID=UPI00261B11D4|nr:penicillin-binding transpeptidase domain-containing protein [uncultured Litoreibacter sp.]